MFKFKSKPIQISGEQNFITILCEDGSIWRWVKPNNDPLQISTYEKTVNEEKPKPEKKTWKTDESFQYFWKLWKDNIKNASAPKDAYIAFCKLSKDEKTALVYSIPMYAKTQPVDKHNYLKRACSYINSGMFNDTSSFVSSKEISIPSMDDDIWKTEIFNQETGITDSAFSQVNMFGMDKSTAIKLIREKSV